MADDSKETSKINCPNCGNELNENQKFCTNCGYSLNSGKTSNNLKYIINGAILALIVFSVIAVMGLTHNSSATNSPVSNSVINNARQSNSSDEYETEEPEIENDDNYSSSQSYSNCVYKTSDGVCFTTQIFRADPIKEKNGNGNAYNNYWLGAEDACKSKGYKLPSDYELRSLFSDILGIEINSGVDVKTVKHEYSTIPTNMEVLKKIAPKSEYSTLNFVRLWENEKFDDERVFVRTKYTRFGDHVTEQYMTTYYNYSDLISTICVNDPSGRPYKSLLQKQKEEEERVKKAEEQRKMQEEIQQIKEAENALF